MTRGTIIFATSNPNKFQTASEHLAPLGIELEHASPHLIEVQSPSLQEIAVNKAEQAYHSLRRPLFVEDSGFYLKELNGFPGPFVKYVLSTIGAAGIAHVADLTLQRRCYFETFLVYMDESGTKHIFNDRGDDGTVATTAVDELAPDAWSALWNIYIPDGCSAPLAMLPGAEREQIFERWARDSVFRAFGDFLVHIDSSIRQS